MLKHTLLSFKSEVDLHIVGSPTSEAGGGKAVIKWNLVVTEKDDRAVFSVKVPNQTIETSVWRYNEDTDEEYEEEITLHVENIKVDDRLNASYFSTLELKPKRLELWGTFANLLF